ncbi:hypothetical protein [Acinetobacter phage BUCT628]|nr:hypothetical protein [Acinetobacter phage BUCT628]
MKYLIYCKRTNRHLATYTNAKTLETLDTSRCYFEKYDDSKAEKKLNEFGVNVKTLGKEKYSKSVSKYGQPYGSSSSQSNDYMNPTNPIGYYATTASLSSYSSSSSSCDSSSSSSYDSSSSSSCDSSSW